jgi:hypothetical protein
VENSFENQILNWFNTRRMELGQAPLQALLSGEGEQWIQDQFNSELSPKIELGEKTLLHVQHQGEHLSCSIPSIVLQTAKLQDDTPSHLETQLVSAWQWINGRRKELKLKTLECLPILPGQQSAYNFFSACFPARIDFVQSSETDSQHRPTALKFYSLGTRPLPDAAAEVSQAKISQEIYERHPTFCKQASWEKDV